MPQSMQRSSVAKDSGVWLRSLTLAHLAPLGGFPYPLASARVALPRSIGSARLRLRLALRAAARHLAPLGGFPYPLASPPAAARPSLYRFPKRRSRTSTIS